MDLTPFKNCLALTNSIFIANEEKPYRPCCWYKTHIDAVDADDYQKQLRELDTETNCDYCIQQEKGGEYSYRQQFDKPDELILTVSFDNICNLACVTCTPANSTQLIQEMFSDEHGFGGSYDKRYFTQISKQAPKKIDFIKTTLATSKFKTLRFDILGGEPLINPAVFEFIDWLAEQPYAKKTNLSVTTNGTTYSDKIIKYLDKFANVIIQLSIDGINKEFEYLRYKSNFETLETVCDSFYALTEQYDNLLLGSHYTLSWMNCLHFAQFFNWAQSKYPNWRIYVSKLDSPEPYSIEVLSLEMRTKIFNKVMEDLEGPFNKDYDRCLFLYKEHMLTTATDEFDKDLFYKGLGLLNVLDTRRGNNHTEIVGDLIKFINYKI